MLHDKIVQAIVFSLLFCDISNIIHRTKEKNLDSQDMEISVIRPQLVQRGCGGWLAVTPDSTALKMGVTAPTEDEARKSSHIRLRSG